MTPARLKRLARRVAAAAPAVATAERVVVLLPDNGRGPPPGRYRIGPAAAVVVHEVAAAHPDSAEIPA